MSGFFSTEGAGAPQGADTQPAATTPAVPPATPQNGVETQAADLTGKPEWMPDAFWVAPAAEKEPDYAAMAEKLAGSLKEGRTKITELGTKLAGVTVPDSVAPYTEGLDRDALLAATKRAGWSTERFDQAVAQLRAAGVGPAPAQAFLQTHLKAIHDATPEAKAAEQLREEAVAQLNAAGRPGSEMMKTIQRVGAAFVNEGKWTEQQAEKLAGKLDDPDVVEAIHAVMFSTQSAPADPVRTRGNAQVLEDLRAEMRDPKFGKDDEYTNRVIKRMEAHPQLLEQVYPTQHATNVLP